MNKMNCTQNKNVEFTVKYCRLCGVRFVLGTPEMSESQSWFFGINIHRAHSVSPMHFWLLFTAKADTLYVFVHLICYNLLCKINSCLDYSPHNMWRLAVGCWLLFPIAVVVAFMAFACKPKHQNTMLLFLLRQNSLCMFYSEKFHILAQLTKIYSCDIIKRERQREYIKLVVAMHANCKHSLSTFLGGTCI